MKFPANLDLEFGIMESGISDPRTEKFGSVIIPFMPSAAKGRHSDRISCPTIRYRGGASERFDDQLAVEEPLEIRLVAGKSHRAVSITMRTPGHDSELAAGFLFTEGILKDPSQILSIKHCGRFPSNRNTIRVDIGAFDGIDLERLKRNFYTTSSCGVCGKSSLEALRGAGIEPIEWTGQLDCAVIESLPAKARELQDNFSATGGLHAAALFDQYGGLIAIREDVGRHNALDKLVGSAFLESRLPLSEHLLLLSGRASFELIQKAAAAGIGVVGAVGAPSSLAVEAAKEFGITLAGFVRDRRFNVYSNEHRIRS